MRPSALGGDQPPAVGRSPEDGGEACRRVETGHAQPVDRTVPAHESSRVRIAYQSVVFEGLAHPSDLRGAGGGPQRAAPDRRPRSDGPRSDGQVASHRKARAHRAHEGADHHDEQPRQQGLM